VDVKQREVSHEFVDGMREREVKKHFLMGSDRSFTEPGPDTKRGKSNSRITSKTARSDSGPNGKAAVAS
jgi:hypothetical protein